VSAAGILRSGILRSPAPRRAATVTLLLLVTAVCAVLIPVVCLFAALVALRPGGRGRLLRFAGFLAVYLAAELAAITGAAGILIRGRLGRGMSAQDRQEAHYALLARLLDWLYTAAARLFGLQVSIPRPDPAPPAARRPGPAVPALPAGPLVVLSRHGGPGDSFLLIHALLNHGQRRPRIVLKDTLMFDPAIDILLSRVPHRFVNPDPRDGHDVAAEIGRLAGDMAPQDVLVIFPEGGKFTPRRRIRAIARLRRRGLRASADRAVRLRHVLPPRPAGVFAALAAAPGADVVFVAHTGLDHMDSVVAVWRSVPLAEPLEATWWTVPAARIPADEPRRLEWLQDNWAEVDTWIDRHRPAARPTAPVPPPAAVPAAETAPAGPPAPHPAPAAPRDPGRSERRCDGPAEP
jgi:1-acyl-sn-glycerol-3-phosphate acyltransferase